MVSRASRTLAVWLSALFLLTPASGLLAGELPIIDAHSQADTQIDFDEILELMDEARVARTILALRGRTKAKDLISFAARHADRITPAVRSKGDPYNKNELGRFKVTFILGGSLPSGYSNHTLAHCDAGGGSRPHMTHSGHCAR